MTSTASGYSCLAPAVYWAKQRCDTADCETVGWVRNGCIAVAVDDTGQWRSSGLTGSPRESRWRALSACEGTGHTCQVTASVCSR